ADPSGGGESMEAMTDYSPPPSPLGSYRPTTRDRGKIGETKELLRVRRLTTVPGVRYPLLDATERGEVNNHYAVMQNEETVTFTYFGRHYKMISRVRNALKRNPPHEPLKVLIAGAGLDEHSERRDSFNTLEWLGTIASVASAGIKDFAIDVLDIDGRVEAYFKQLVQGDSYTFDVFERNDSRGNVVVPASYVRRNFDGYWTNVTREYRGRLPEGATQAFRITLPPDLLRKIHFKRGSVVGPLPGSGYHIAVYQHVEAYVASSAGASGGTALASVVIRNLLLNLSGSGGWLVSDSNYLPESFLPRRDEAIFIPKPREEDSLESQPGGGWKLMEVGTPRRGNGGSRNGGNGGGLVYRNSNQPNRAVRHDGSELLGVYSGRLVFEGPSDMVRGGLGLGPSISPEVLGAFENNLPRLPARPLFLP
ncbi:MAG: hypothetical protein Q7S98_05385, partial [Deltaproteobacteria bacterium]|nr:hypothetical protein [Deltaproteobacteria bacterium]